MNKHLTHSLAALTLLATALTGTAVQATTIASWDFAEAAGTALNNTVNSGVGVDGLPSGWDTAINGLSSTGTGTGTGTGAGQLNIQNQGAGGSGTRSAYADFGPAPGGVVSSGMVSLYTSFSAFDFRDAAGLSPRFTLALIEGNNFVAAQFSFGMNAGALQLWGDVDPWGNGTALAQSASFNPLGSTPLTVRLDLNLQAHSYGLSYDAGAGFVSLGYAAVDSFTAGVNSLRLDVAGDFTFGGQRSNTLLVDRIWVDTTVTAVPEPGTAALWLCGFASLLMLARRKREKLA